MIRHKPKWLLAGLLLLPLWSAPPALAEESQLDGFFRSGVAAWERRDYGEAERQIGAALEEAKRIGNSDKLLIAGKELEEKTRSFGFLKSSRISTTWTEDDSTGRPDGSKT